ncbi:MAG: AcrR family transcriptional regulator [Myxococcota bacterium]|jgi:AcrR family transcriptional regulator
MVEPDGLMPTRQFDSVDPATRVALIEAAAAEFSEHGYEAGSLNRIITEAGVSKTKFYRWFDDKADLWRTVVRHLVGRFLTRMAMPAAPMVDPASFWGEVRRQWRLTLAVYAEWPPAAGLVRELARSALVGDGSGALAEAVATIRASLEVLIRVGQHVGAVRTDLPFDLVLALAAGTSDSVDVWLAEHPEVLADPEASDALADDLTDLMRRMATPSTVEAQ